MMTKEPGSVSEQKFGKRAATGAFVLIASRLATRAIDLLALVVLGRLLSPADFGLVAIAMSVMMIVEAVMELPVFFALVAFRERERAHYDTAFTLLVIKGMLLTLVLLVLAWPLSQIYNDHRLIWLVCVLGIAPVSRGLGSPRMIDYSINFDFRPNFVMEVIGKLVGLTLSVTLAWSTQSYWALAAGTVAVPITTSVLSYIYAPYLPTITIKEWRAFSGFLGWTTLTQAIAAANWQMDQLLLGRFVSRFELGRFSMASNLSLIPWQIFIVQVISPLLVAFSQVKDDAARLKAAYRKSVTTIVTIGLPVMVGMSITAEPIIRIILGDQWLESVSMLRWLALAAIPPMFAAPLSPLSIALNRTIIFFWLALIEAAVKLPLTLVIIYFYGIEGVLMLRVALSVVMVTCSMLAARDLIRLSLWEQLVGSWRAVLSVLVMAVTVMPLESLLGRGGGVPQLIFGLAIMAGIGACAYAGSIFALWRLSGRPPGLEADVLSALETYSGKLFRRAFG
jgi:O-antigen/teichoic acid export membrane protein